MARKWLAGAATLASVLGVIALFAGSETAVAASTICDNAGLPTSQQTVGVPGVVHVTVSTCNAEQTPSTPQCSISLDQPHVFHVRVFVCTVLNPGTTNASNASFPPTLVGPGKASPPPDCAYTVNQTVAGIGVMACVDNGSS